MSQQRPLARGDVSKNRKRWKWVREAAQQRLSGLGGVLDWSPYDYEVLRWVHPDLTLIFYQHKTSANNYHVRMRAGVCNDRKLLEKCIHATAENSCQFYFPSERQFHDAGVGIAIQTNRGYTPC